MIVHFCEITNSGYFGNKPFLVLQADGLLEGSVQILDQPFGLCSLGVVLCIPSTAKSLEQLRPCLRASSVHLRTLA